MAGPHRWARCANCGKATWYCAKHGCKPAPKPLTREQAVTEARIGSKLKGGTWYVTRRATKYNVVPADMYDSGRHGRIVETIDVYAERVSRQLAD